jgi:hypothetical protein
LWDLYPNLYAIIENFKRKPDNMKSIVNFILIPALFIFFTSCEEDGYADFDQGQTNVQELSGEWWVAGFGPNGELVSDYHVWATYNTANNNDTIWLDDHGSAVDLKTRVEANTSGLTFGNSTETPEVFSGGTVLVQNGLVIPEGTRAPVSGAVVDSIYFEAEFDWDPGVIYTFQGHSRTGFLEDEDPHFQE